MNEEDIGFILGKFVDITDHGLEYALHTYYGLYKGIVVDNKDPERRGRVRVRIVDLQQAESSDQWIVPVYGYAGANLGTFCAPEVGTVVRVFFAVGDQRQPVGYFGGFHGQNEVPSEFRPGTDLKPMKKGFVTRAGHGVLFDDTPGSEALRVWWHKPASGDASFSDPTVAADRTKGEYAYVDFRKDGSIVLVNAAGGRLQLDAANKRTQLVDPAGNLLMLDEKGLTISTMDGSFLQVGSSGINVSSARGNVTVTAPTVTINGGVNLGSLATFSAVLGEPLLLWLATHGHPQLGAPPAVPPPPGILSSTVKLQ